MTSVAATDNALARRGANARLRKAPACPRAARTPLNTNASENDIRVVVTKRKVSDGTVSESGRIARDVMLGLAKTCAKFKISFFPTSGRDSKSREQPPHNSQASSRQTERPPGNLPRLP